MLQGCGTRCANVARRRLQQAYHPYTARRSRPRLRAARTVCRAARCTGTGASAIQDRAARCTADDPQTLHSGTSCQWQQYVYIYIYIYRYCEGFTVLGGALLVKRCSNVELTVYSI